MASQNLHQQVFEISNTNENPVIAVFDTQVDSFAKTTIAGRDMGTLTTQVPIIGEMTEERRKFLESVKVEDIHNEFFLAHERLLAEAKEYIGRNENEETELYAKLYSLGFGRIEKAEESSRHFAGIEFEKETIELVNYYLKKYPQYKFITGEKVRQICEKYDLLMGDPSNFIDQNIPLKNVKEIVNFKIKDEDIILHCNGNPYNGDPMSYKPMTLKDFKEQRGTAFDLDRHEQNVKTLEEGGSIWLGHAVVHTPKFKICATADLFDMNGYQLQGRQIVQILKNDPIVLYPVNEGYLIVSAWGQEASDPEVVNQKMN